ncbi:quinolinate synthase NadA [Algoriphagus aestuariicola]|uniref:Quinolinate synthase n=1 Tax=Algoriphagus aestuariicola TaxID=1852016 RepID=A0ABS3BRI0_9BACT|nr:quinolinate synthase NadA [Algoriphagus aestuariicola]MBN7801897.1 quinolinate synthase NadA [Algoriphagus aestuariicola]
MDLSPLQSQLVNLKTQKNAVILAHYYQRPEIQQIADHVGDSLELSRKASESIAEILVFCGVHFMAETAKILNPNCKVLIPDLEAGCSLADSCAVLDFVQMRKSHPDHLAVSYINCSAEIKAHSDYICTSSNAVKIINSFPRDQKIIFAPDRNLGEYLIRETGREMVLWDGACAVHEAFSVQKLIELVQSYPSAKILAHPESKSEILKIAHFTGSTSAMIRYITESSADKFLIGTEAGILHQMKELAPEKTLIPIPTKEDTTCACSECAYMKVNTLQKVLQCLETESPEIILDPLVSSLALVPIRRMLQLS